MMDFIGNQWVIGIGGGIFSGLLVTLITRKFFASKDNREYLQKINLANSEIIYAIKPFIVDGEVPDIEIIESMQAATARKHGLDLKDLSSIKEILENIIKEIMDTSFISHNLKREYCEKLFSLRPNPSDKEVMESHTNLVIAEYRQRVLTVFSTVLGVFAGLVTMYTGLLATAAESELFSNLKIVLPSFISFLMAYGAFMFFKLSKKQNLEENDEQAHITKKSS